MNQTKTVGKQLVWQAQVGRVHAAAWEFERMPVYDMGAGRTMKGAVFVDRAVVLNVGQQESVWLDMRDVQSVRDLLDLMDADRGDLPDGPDKPRYSEEEVARRAAESLSKPQVNGCTGEAGEDARVAQCRRVIQASIRAAREPPSDACTRAAACSGKPVGQLKWPGPSGDGGENDGDIRPDGEEEYEERQRVIREVLWKDFEALRPLCDTRRLPSAVKAAYPVSPLSLTQWVNDTRHNGGDEPA